MNEIIVSIKNGIPAVSSLEVAAVFGKQHKNVLRTIRLIIDTELSDPEINGLKLGPVENIYISDTYEDDKGEQRPMFWMPKEGFLALTLRFTGKPAAKLRLQVIHALMAVEVELAAANAKLNDPGSIDPHQLGVEEFFDLLQRFAHAGKKRVQTMKKMIEAQQETMSEQKSAIDQYRLLEDKRSEQTKEVARAIKDITWMKGLVYSKLKNAEAILRRAYPDFEAEKKQGDMFDDGSSGDGETKH